MPASEKIWVEMGGKRLELSNLDKPMYPADGIVKAEVISYYVEVAPYLLHHAGNRPVALIRFPDGIEGETFFHKNMPDWMPHWIRTTRVGDGSDTNRYMVPDSPEAVAWAANFAALEIHTWQTRAPHFDRPDWLVFDLDAPPELPFEQVKDLAFRLRGYLERFGYVPFVKTSGKKGLHVMVPLVQQESVEIVFDAAKELASGFVRKYGKETTLRMSKQKRGDKTLVDIYRMGRGQTVVGPYSLRGVPGAPVSMPVTWEQLEDLDSPAIFNLRTVPDILKDRGDAWDDMWAYTMPLHTLRGDGAAASVPELKAYAGKRDFSKTREPKPVVPAGVANAFVLHRHHATRLHYDLRIAQNGILRSWAVPKGLPPRPGIKRMAVNTEDHPLEYLTFEGTIPKGEYGGGRMWIYTTGRYEVMKQEEGKLYVRLLGKHDRGEYRLFRTRENEWMIERLDEPATDWTHTTIKPMLASLDEQIPRGDYAFEVKWDGIRALITIDEGNLCIRTRNGIDVTASFPELATPDVFRTISAVFDAEIVCLDQTGKPNFASVITRMKNPPSKKRTSKPACTVRCMLFDCLYLDGLTIMGEPWYRRREWLVDSLKEQDAYWISTDYEDGESLFDSVEELGLEGILAKRRQSPYRIGERSRDWLKVKVRRVADCLIVGYSRGKGTRGPLGAVHVAEIDEEDRPVYRGKVGTGFSEALLKKLDARLKQIETAKPDVEDLPKRDADSTWVEPILGCEISYSEVTEDGRFRHPVFIKLRPDLDRKAPTK